MTQAAPMSPRSEAVWLFSSIVASVLLGGCGDGSFEASTSRYADYQEAEDAGAIERGWLPRNLPSGAYNIVESHNIDSNEVWAAFESDEAGATAFLRGCVKTHDVQWPSHARVGKMATWWPQMLTEGARQFRSGRVFYRCSDVFHAETRVDAYAAFDPKSLTVWYWIER